MHLTVAEVAQKLDVERELAYGLVRFLVSKKLASLRGTRPSPTGRGKAENVYDFSEKLAAGLHDLGERLRR